MTFVTLSWSQCFADEVGTTWYFINIIKGKKLDSKTFVTTPSRALVQLKHSGYWYA